MSLCALCSIVLHDDQELCAHHLVEPQGPCDLSRWTAADIAAHEADFDRRPAPSEPV